MKKKSLITILFHGLFKNKKEIEKNNVHPQQAITVDIFRQFVEYFLDHKYFFISPQDILQGLTTDKNYVLITFDDGYYNNHLSLSILKEYQIPAIFFISTDHVTQNKCFWWDVIFRERLKIGSAVEKIEKEIQLQLHKKNTEIEEYIKKNINSYALNPLSDIDRPFTTSELRQFAKEKVVFLGNHTCGHAILTNYSPSEIRSEIYGAQKTLSKITGKTPMMIAYPNGNYSENVLFISKECGLKQGITLNRGKNYLPIETNDYKSFLLNRYILWGDSDISKQCDLFRSDIQMLKLRLKNSLKKLYKG